MTGSTPRLALLALGTLGAIGGTVQSSGQGRQAYPCWGYIASGVNCQDQCANSHGVSMGNAIFILKACALSEFHFEKLIAVRSQ